jgi:hypothetical protein
LAALLLGAPARAYQRDEHYYSARVALAAVRPPLEGAGVAAMCAQLADEAPELNAIAAYERLMRHPFDYVVWSAGGSGPDATVGRMVTVQQLLHGLTGGPPAAVRAAAVGAVRAALAAITAAREPAARADALCALGFSLHLYGDSFAHRRLRNPNRMYRTGIGHLFDASTPDFPLCAPDRLELWKEYAGSLPALLSASPRAASSARLDALLSGLAEHQRAARPANAYSREALERQEIAELTRRGVTPAPLPLNDAKRPCQALVDDYARDRGWKEAPSCERSWTLFRAWAERGYAAYDADPAHKDAPSRPGAARAFYDGPLFDGSAR